MKKRRRFQYQPRAKAQEKIDDAQDSFLDVVSNLVGILIILVMIAGARVHKVAAETLANNDESTLSAEDREEQEARAKFVEAVENLTDARMRLEQARAETEDFNERFLSVERQAENAEQEYRDMLAASAQIDAALKAEALSREDAEQIEYDLKSEIFEKEKKRDDLQREKDALNAARPQATVLENLPTPISRRVEDGREDYFQLKNGKIAHVPLREFSERMKLSFQNFRGDITKPTLEEKIGPVENFTFHYIVDLHTNRERDGIHYSLNFRYGECTPVNDVLGEPVDDAIASPQSAFCQALLKNDRRDTTITIFVYPDSFEYLRDIKKFLFSLKYTMAMRPLPDGVPISVSPQGTSSASY